MLSKTNVFVRIHRIIFVCVCVSAAVSVLVRWNSVLNVSSPAFHKEDHVFKAVMYLVPSSQLAQQETWNDTERMSRLTRTIDMSKLRLQRLKAWANVEILGGEICPVRIAKASGNQNRWMSFSGPIHLIQKDQDTTNEAEDDYTIMQCPRFQRCESSVLQEVSFCNLRSLDNMPIVPFIPPRSVQGAVLSGLPHALASLSWRGQLIQVTGESFFNNFGHAFTRDRQYLHGGCQDIPDRNNGGFKIFNASTLVRVRSVDRALNLVHLHGNNFYHFLIEVLPRLFLSKSLIKRFPDIPIYIKPTPFLHLLKLIDLDPESLNLRFIDKSNDLIFTEKYQYFPLAPRCLHAPSSLWRSIRKTFSKQIPKLFGVLESTSKRNNIVYISRENVPYRRHVLRETEFIANLTYALNMKQLVGSNNFYSVSFTFRVLYGNESFSDTMIALHDANTVIGPHGAGLANAVFAPRVQRILEFAAEGYWNPCFLYLANGIKVDHYLLRVNGSHNGHLYLNQTNADEIAHWLKT